MLQQQQYKQAERLISFLFENQYLLGHIKRQGIPFIDLYEKNVKAFVEYPYLFRNTFPAFHNLSIYFIHIIGENYISFITGKKAFGEIYKTPYFRSEKVFFEKYDLNKPLLLHNEFNYWNLKFLCDSMRESADFGRDNHIYLYYDSFEKFCSYMQMIDFSEILKTQKVVFIFGEVELHSYYPLDFKNLFHVDYNEMECQPVRLEEVNRACYFDVGGFGFSGTQFLSEIMDWHPNLLTIPMYHANVFPCLYEVCFEGKTVKEMLNIISCRIQIKSGIKELDKILVEWLNDRAFFSILADVLQAIEKPSKLQWFQAFYLAYALQKKRNFTGRMKPVIYYDPHWSSHSVRFCLDIIKDFSYFNILMVIRDNVAQFDSATHNFFMKKKQSVNNSATYHLHYFFNARCSLFELKSWYKVYFSKLFHRDLTDEFMDQHVSVIRFEDLKLWPKAALWSLCEYLNIPWDESLLKCTQNGNYSNTGGFDPKPVYRRWKECYNDADAYRLEYLFSDVYSQYGYIPKFYDGKQYTEEQGMNLFLQFFELEKLDMNLGIYEKNRRYKWILWLVNWFYSPEGERIRKQQVVRWLKPKLNMIEGKLYE